MQKGAESEDSKMIAVGKERIEKALKEEHRTRQRQSLLKQLWKLNQDEPPDEHEELENAPEGSVDEAKSPNRGAKSPASRAPRRASSDR